MGKDRSGTKLCRFSHVVVFLFVPFQRSRQELVHLDGSKCSLARHPHMQYGPVAAVEDHCEKERELNDPDENPLHLEANFIPLNQGSGVPGIVVKGQGSADTELFNPCSGLHEIRGNRVFVERIITSDDSQA
jgi:hypothetical protein